MNFEFKLGTQQADENARSQDEYKKRLYNKYSSERDNLSKTALEIGSRYDKAVFVLAGGALALSITFIEKISPNPTWISIMFLVVSWIFLLICLVLSLFATSNSQSAFKDKLSFWTQHTPRFLIPRMQLPSRLSRGR